MKVARILILWLLPSLAFAQAYTGNGNAYVPGISSGNGNYGTLGYCFIGNGPSALPSWQPCSAGGTGTVSPGLAGQIATYSSTGTAVAGNANAALVNGLQLGTPTGGDEGIGTLNATGIYVNGVAVSGGSGCTLANPTGTIGLTAVNGSATTCMRSDGAPALSQAITPIWTGVHTFTNSDIRMLGSSTGYTTFTSANASATNYTVTVPAATDTLALLGTAQTFGAVKTFTNSDLCLMGSSTGCTTFTSANVSATNYTTTFPAATDTVVELTQTQTLTNKSIAASEVNSGTLSCSQMPALTGAVTTSTGSCATSIPGQLVVTTTGTTLALGNAGQQIYNTDASANTITIPPNSSVPFPVATCMMFVNDFSAAVLTIVITTDTMTLSPTGLTGSRSLAAGGVATVCKYTATKWVITGSGLT